MRDSGTPRFDGRGQVIVLFAIFLSVIVMGVGLVVDGGNALNQRREAQNAADFAALGGARVIAEWIDGDTANGSDANVEQSITSAVAANGGSPVVFGSPDGPRYVQSDGTLLGRPG